MLNVYYAEVAPLLDETVWEKQIARVRPERQKKASACKVRMDACRSLGAGLLLAFGLRRAGVDYENASFLTGEYGKMELSDAFSGRRLYFNLSHAGSFAVCAVSDQPVGADIEQIDRDYGRVAGRVFTSEERSWIEAASADGSNLEEMRRKTAELWTRKESYAKMTGRGLSMDFKEIATLRTGCYYSCLPDEGHILTVCLQRPEEERALYQVALLAELTIEREGVL